MKRVVRVPTLEGSLEGITAPAHAILPNGSGRRDRESVKLRDSLLARSDMADALVEVLGLWRRSVLVMDEVDVLLHPLRSELNFPIGHKVTIE